MPIVTTSPRNAKKKSYTLLIAVLAVVVIAGVAFLMMRKQTVQAPNIEPQTSSIEPVKAVEKQASIVNPKTVSDTQTPIINPQPTPEMQTVLDEEGTPITITKEELKKIQKGRENAVIDSNRQERIQAALEAQKPKKYFDNDVENMLESVSKVGFESLETPRVDMSHDEIITFLKRPVEIYEDDDEEAIAAKERVAEVKADALKYIENGGTLNQYLRDYATQVKEDNETVKDIKDEMKRILKEKGVDAAQAYLDEVNPQLKEAGLAEVKIGKGTIKMIERQKAREAAEAAQK